MSASISIASTDRVLSRTDIVFIDGSLPDIDQLIAAARPGTEVVVLDPAQDGLLQIAQALAGKGGIDAIHVLSHGTAGALELGSAHVTQDSLATYGDALGAIRAALSPNADLLLYGCDVAQGVAGQSFLEALAAATGADVAASTDLTGSALLHGNWELETSVGHVETASLGADGALAAYAGVLGPLPPSNHAPTIQDAISTSVGTGTASALPDYKVADADGDNLTVTLTATNGSINALADADNNAANGIQLTGSASTINAALANATFTAANNGRASVTISVSDDKGGGPVTKTSYLAATSPALSIVDGFIDGAMQTTSDRTSLLTGADGNIYMAMTSAGSTLSIFRWNGNAWAEAVSLDASSLAGGSYTKMGETVPIGVDQYGKIHALVSLNNGDGTGASIRVATYDGTHWSSTEVETLGVVNNSTLSYTLSGASVTVTSDNIVNISYHRAAGVGSTTSSGNHQENFFITNASGSYTTFASDGVAASGAAAVATLEQVAGTNGYSFLIQAAADKNSLVVSDYQDGAFLQTRMLTTEQTLVGAATDAAGALQVVTMDGSNGLYLWKESSGVWTSTAVPAPQDAGHGYIPYNQVSTDNATGRPGLVRGLDGKIFLAVYEVDADEKFVGNKILTLENGQWVDGLADIDSFNLLISPTFAVDASGNLMLVDADVTADLPYVFGHYTDFRDAPAATPPVFVSAAVDGAKLVLTYDKTLDDSQIPAASTFTVKVGGADVAVTGVTVDATDKTVSLTLATPVLHGQTVTVGYTDPSAGNDPNAIQDGAGNDAASLVNQAVTNNSSDMLAPALASAVVTGTSLVLTYDETLDNAHGPAKADFTVKVGGQDATVSNVTVDAAAKTVTLTLASAVHGNDVVTVSYTDSSGGTHAIQDAAGNDAAGLSNHAVSNQSNDAPTIGNVPVGATAVVTGQASALPDFTVADVDGDNLTVTLTATNGVINGVSDADSTTGGIQLGGSAATINAALAAATFTATANGAASIGISVTDGKVATPVTSMLTLSAAADTVAPRIASIIRHTSTTAETNADTVAWDVTFNEAVGNVDAGDFEVDMYGITLTVLNLGNNVYRVTAAGGDLDVVDGQIELSIKQGHNITDLAGNALQDTTPVGANEYFYEIDNSAPEVRTIEREQPARTDADQLSWKVGFIDEVKNVKASDFTVSGTSATVTGVEDMGNRNYRVTVSGGDLATMNGTVTLGFASNATLTDVAGNVLGDTTPAQDNEVSYTVDNSVPALTSAIVSGTALVLTYNEALHATGPGAGTFTVQVDGESVTVSNAVVDAANGTVTLTLAKAVQPNQAVKLWYTDPTNGNDPAAIQDAAGNDAASLVNHAVTNNALDTLAPTLATATIVGDKLVLTYSEALDGAHKPGAGAFVVKIGTGTVNVTDVAIDGAGKTVTLTLDHVAQPGDDVKVSYGAQNGTDVIQDVAGNDAAGVTDKTVTNSSGDTLAPTLTSATIVGDKLVLTYDEALDENRKPDANAFAVKIGNQVVNVTTAVVNGIGKTITLTLDQVAQPGDTVKVSYGELTNQEAIQDAVGNRAEHLSDHAVGNNSLDTLAPTLATATIVGDKLVLTYSEALDGGHKPGAGAFVVKIGTGTVNVTDVAIDGAGKTVTLTLDQVAQPGEDVKVSYGAQNNVDVIQDAAGNDAAGVTDKTVANSSGDTLAPALATATIVGDKLVLTYSEALDGGHKPGAGAFVVKIGTGTVNVTDVAIDGAGKTVTLTLDHVAQPGDDVKVSYGAQNGTDVIQDVAGNDAAGVTDKAVTNSSLDTLAPTLASATIVGDKLVLTYSEALSTVAGPEANAFAVEVGGQPVDVTHVTIVGKTVTLTLGHVAQPDDIVKVSYGELTNAEAIQDGAGNIAAPMINHAVVNESADTLAPTLESARVFGTTLVLEYNEALDLTQQPGANAFVVKVGGQAVTVTAVVVNDDKTVTLTLDKVVQPDDIVKVSYQVPANGGVIQDAAGNDAAGVTDKAVNNNAQDTLAPTLTSAVVTGTSLVLTYSEKLYPQGPLAGAFAVTVGGSAVGVTQATVNSLDGTVTLTLDKAVQPNQVVKVSYLEPTGIDVGVIEDMAGNDAASVIGHAVTNTSLDTLAPAMVIATVNGNKLVLTYGEALDTHGPDAGAFTVHVGDNVVAVTNVAIDSANGTVTLTLASAATSIQSVTVSYQDPSEGNDANAIQDLAGNDAASLINRSVINTTPAPTPPVTPPAESTVDGVKVVTEQVRNADGSLSTKVTIPVVTSSRNEQVGNNDLADIPLVRTASGGNVLTAQLPVGFGLTTSGSGIKAAADSLTDLIREIKAHTAAGSADQDQLTGGGSGFLGDLAASTNLLVQTIVPVHAGDSAPNQPLAIIGMPASQGGPQTALVLDGSQLPAGTHITLDNVDFAALIGAINVSGGAGSQKVWGDSASQTIFLGADDDTLHGGGGDDIVGSAGGNDHVYGDEGEDIVFGGEGDDYVDGGSGHDIARYSGAGRDGYSLRVQDGKLVMKDLHGADGTDTVVDVEVLRFTGAAADTTLRGTVARLVEASGAKADDATVARWVDAIAKGASTAAVANGLLAANGLDKLGSAAFVDALYHNVLGRDADAAGKAAWVKALDGGGVDRAGAALLFADSAEKIAMGRSVDLDFNHSDVATLVRMYETLFARHADEGGLNFWIGLHESGNSLAQLADWFVASNEAAAQYGALTDAQFVDTLYHTAFDRSGTAAEQKFWLDNLAAGAIDRGDVLLGFADSAEMLTVVGAINTSIPTI